MNRIALLLATSLMAASLWAQDQVVSTRIITEPGGEFIVDGHIYMGAETFFWPENSKHTLAIRPVQELASGVRITYSGAWTDSAGHTIAPTVPGGNVIITADRSISYYKTAAGSANVTEVRLMLEIQAPGDAVFNCNGAPGAGKVLVGATCFDQRGEVWVPPGSQVRLEADAPLHSVFGYWDTPATIPSHIATITVTSPMVVIAHFNYGGMVTFATTPPGLQVLADRAVLTTPTTLEWGWDTSHSISPVSPQVDLYGRLWVFKSWEHGGEETQIYQFPRESQLTLTANYVPGARVSFVTQPVGLKLNVDGRQNWPAYNFAWAIGSTHTVSAPAEQVDARGQKYVFKGWANGGDATQQITVPDSAAADGLWLTAVYEPLGTLVVKSNPPDVPVMIDGAECRTPCTISRNAGAQVKISAPQSVPVSDETRLAFKSWADGGSNERTWTAGKELTTLFADYNISYRVMATSEPAGSASVVFQPASTDGFYPANSEITLVAQAKPGYRFKLWRGDVDSVTRTTVVYASSPLHVQAVFEKVPYVGEAGVRNAAAELPEPGVAPGSIIAIFGGNLATATEVGPQNPLQQTLAGATVQVAGRLLPLFFVSPEQINALLPSDLEPGDYTLKIQTDGQTPITAQAKVVRNAPGLFVNEIDERPFLIATHADGSIVTTEKPAQQGETITLLGTGFGPYEKPVLDGFPVQDSFKPALVDKVEVIYGDRVIEPVAATAAANFVGVSAIKLKITDVFPAAGTAELKVRVKGHESNTGLLPLK